VFLAVRHSLPLSDFLGSEREVIVTCVLRVEASFPAQVGDHPPAIARLGWVQSVLGAYYPLITHR
jgi:hypothetical protein